MVSSIYNIKKRLIRLKGFDMKRIDKKEWIVNDKSVMNHR